MIYPFLFSMDKKRLQFAWNIFNGLKFLTKINPPPPYHIPLQKHSLMHKYSTVQIVHFFPCTGKISNSTSKNPY